MDSVKMTEFLVGTSHEKMKLFSTVQFTAIRIGWRMRMRKPLIQTNFRKAQTGGLYFIMNLDIVIQILTM